MHMKLYYVCSLLINLQFFNNNNCFFLISLTVHITRNIKRAVDCAGIELFTMLMNI